MYLKIITVNNLYYLFKTEIIFQSIYIRYFNDYLHANVLIIL